MRKLTLLLTSICLAMGLAAAPAGAAGDQIFNEGDHWCC